MIKPIVLTKKFKTSDFDGFLVTDEHIEHNGKLIPINALWDTGSSESVISCKLVRKLSLQSIGTAFLNGTNSANKTKLYEITFILANQQRINLQVTESPQIEGSGIDLLIGLDVISMCDFALSTDDKSICMSIRYPSRGSLIDFSKE